VGIWDSLVTYTSLFDPKTEKILPSIPPGATGLEANRLTLFNMEVSSNDKWVMAGTRCTYAVCNHYFKVLLVEHTYIFGISGSAVVSTDMITCPSSCPVQYVLLPA
jgi:hypothetical protein